MSNPTHIQVAAQVSAIVCELNSKKRAIQKEKISQKELGKRLERHQNPRFLHYFVLGRDTKVEEIKCKIENSKKNVETLNSQVNLLNTRLRDSEQKLTKR